MARRLCKAWKTIAILACTALVVMGVQTGAAADKVDEVNALLDKALSDDSLAAAANKTTDPEVLIGLAAYASPDKGSRIIERAAKLAPDKAPMISSVRAGWRFDDNSVDAFVKADAANALPHYFKALLLYEHGKDAEALKAMEEGTACKTFDTYTTQIARWAIKALDKLGLDRREKLIAVNRVYSAAGYPQKSYERMHQLVEKISGAASKRPRDEQTRISDALIRMSNQLLTSPDAKRYPTLFAVKRMLVTAYVIKGNTSAESEANAVIARALSVYIWDPDISSKPLSRIRLSVHFLGEPAPTIESVFGYVPQLDAATEKQVKSAIAEVSKAREALLDVASNDAYDVEVLEAVSGSLAAEKAVDEAKTHRKVLDAADDWQKAMMALSRIPHEVATPASESTENLKKIGLACLMYAEDNNGALPPDMETLVQKGYINSPQVTKSPITQKPYVYLGKGGKADTNIVIAYDEAKLSPDSRIALFSDGHVEIKPAADLEKRLKEQGTKAE